MLSPSKAKDSIFSYQMVRICFLLETSMTLTVSVFLKV